MTSRRSFLLAIPLALASARVGNVRAQAERNPVVEYFRNAEIQTETNKQQEQVIAVLTDLSERSASSIRERRYADDDGNAGKWTAFLVVKRHIVPARPTRLTEEMLYRDVERTDVRSAVRQALEAYRKLTRPQKAPTS